MSVERRRFSPPWDIEDNGACFIIRDANGKRSAMSIMRTSPAAVPLRDCSRAMRQGV